MIIRLSRLSGVLILFSFLVFNPLIFQSFWENEGKYIYAAKQSVADILLRNAWDQSPVYFIFLHYWMELAGTSEWALRLPSALFGLFALFFLYRIGAGLGGQAAGESVAAGRSLGLLSALFLALSPLVVGMSQEVKHWTLYLFLCVFSVDFLLQYLHTSERKYLFGFCAATLVNFYTCLYAAANFFALGASLFSFWLAARFAEDPPSPGLRAKTKDLGWAAAILFFLFLPQLLRMQGAVDFVNWQGAQWGMPKKFPDFFLLAAKDLIGFSYRGPLDFVWLGIGLVFLVLGILRSDWKIGVFAFFWIVPMLWAGYEMAGKASIRERYFIALIPMCSFLMARGVLSFQWPRLRIAGTVLLAAMAVPPLVQYYASHRHDNRNFMNEDWRGAVAYIAKHHRPHDVLILIPGRVIEGWKVYSRLPVVYTNQLKLDHFLHYGRAWVISVYGEYPVDPSYPVLERAAFSNIWIKLYDLHPLGDFIPEASLGRYDFRERLKDAKISALPIQGGSIPYSVWKGDGIYLGYGGETGSWGEGLITGRREPKKNLSVPEDPWKTAAKTYQESGGKLRPVIWAHPVEGATLTLAYSNVPLSKFLRGFLGLTDLGVQQGKAPVEFKIQVDGETVFETFKANQAGWLDFAVSTEKWRGRRRTVTFSIFAGSIRWRHFCFNAWTDERDLSPLRLHLAGDIILSRGVAAKIKEKKDPFFPFRKMETWLKKAEIAFANLESPLSARGSTVAGKEIYFRSDPALAPALRKAGFDTFSLSNNHILDFGAEAASDSIQTLKKLGIQAVGLDWTPAPQVQDAKVVTRNGVRVGFLGYSFIPAPFQNLWPQPFALDISQLRKDVAEARRRADIVVVSAHWGHEYSYAAEPFQQNFARAAVDAGANVVVGTHPHVVQEVERYKHGIIFYSLGDFVFDMPADWHRLKTWPALAAEVTLNHKGYLEGTELLPVWIDENYQPDFKNVFEAGSLWKPPPSKTGFSFSESLKIARVETTQNQKTEPCVEWKTNRVSGPVFISDRWSCLERPDFGVTKIRERSGGVFRDGLLATLERGTGFQIYFPETHLPPKLNGFFGWTDLGLEAGNKKSARMEVYLGGKKLWSGHLKNESGWKNFEIPAKEFSGKTGSAGVKIQNEGDPASFVFNIFSDPVEESGPPSWRLIKIFSHKEDPNILWPKSVKISADGQRAYIQNLDGRNTMILNARTFKREALIPHEGKPVETAFTDKGRYVWISYLALIGKEYPPYKLEWTQEKGWDTEYRFPSMVAVYDTKKGEIIRRIPVGVRPKFLEATPDERYVLVSNWSDDSVSVMDAKKFKVIKTVKVRTSPRGIAFSKDGRLAYVANMRAKSLAVIDMDLLEVIRWIEQGIGEGPRHLVRNLAGDRLYISDNWAGQIQVMDLNQDKVIQNVKVGNLPRSIVLSPDERWLYVDNYGSRTVSVVDLEQGKEVSTLKTAEEPVGIDITPDGRQLWVTCYRAHQIMVFGRVDK